MEVPQLKEQDKKQCVLGNQIQLVEKAFEQDIIAIRLDLEPKQDIGLAETGKLVYVLVGL